MLGELTWTPGVGRIIAQNPKLKLEKVIILHGDCPKLLSIRGPIFGFLL